METAIDRIMQTYSLLANRPLGAGEEARIKVTNYVSTLFEAGEKDPHRLAVFTISSTRPRNASIPTIRPSSIRAEN